MHALPEYPKRVHLARCVALLLALAALSACGEASSSGETSDPRAPTEENYRRAIAVSLDAFNPACVQPKALRAVRNQDGFPLTLQTNMRVNRLLLDELDALEEARLLQSSEAGQDTRQFVLTERGEAAFQEARTRVRTRNVFCFATPEVVSISNVEERGDLRQEGSSVEVSFTYRLRDVADWTVGEPFLQAFPQAAEALEAQATPHEAHTMLVLTSEGWVDERLH